MNFFSVDNRHHMRWADDIFFFFHLFFSDIHAPDTWIWIKFDYIHCWLSVFEFLNHSMFIYLLFSIDAQMNHQLRYRKKKWHVLYYLCARNRFVMNQSHLSKFIFGREKDERNESKTKNKLNRTHRFLVLRTCYNSRPLARSLPSPLPPKYVYCWNRNFIII